MAMTKFSELGALERFIKLGEIHAKAEKMIADASIFHVDAIFAGIKDFFQAHGVPEGEFLNKLQEKVQAKKAESKKGIDSLFAALTHMHNGEA